MKTNTPTKLEILLAILSDGQWHSSSELIEKVGHRFSAVVHVARNDGHNIERRKDNLDNDWRLIKNDSKASQVANSQSSKDKNKAKALSMLLKLEKLGITSIDLLEMMAARATEKKLPDQAAILEDVVKLLKNLTTD